MKIHAKKKAFRAFCKDQARKDMIVRGDGMWIRRSQAADNSMKRDFWPQNGKS